MSRSFRLLTLFHLPVEVSYSWFIIFGLVIFTLAHGYFPATNPELSQWSYWIMATISAVLLFASLLAHEFSHSLVAIRNNLPISGITLFVFGGVAHMEKEPSSAWIEFKMALAGPGMSYFLAIVFFAVTQTLYGLGLPAYILSITNYLFLINLMVGTFNLIPGFPLDGGRVLRSLIWGATRNLRVATRIAAIFGKVFAFLLMAWGFLNIISGSLISGTWLVFIGIFLEEAADISYRQTAQREAMRLFELNKE